ncbi:MAG TPA: hypothetical protein VNA25_12595 [Phycisphaerae bacterium]|jgi:hypothetical protein|nr:hypothetical protein [Phycisphaerae bacterium]
MRRGIKLDALVKHLSVFGLSGSGKTTALYYLLMQLSSRCIPFIVLETGKTEYRLLKCLKHHKDRRIRQLARVLRVYTPGSSVSPMRHNPLAERPGVSRDQHIENLLACFKAAMPMSGPLPALLGESLEQVYEGYVDNQPPPRMADLVAAMKRTLSSKGYSRDVDSDIRAALEVRLGVLTRRLIGEVFQCPVDVPSIEDLATKYSIIELAALPQEQACLLALFILTAIQEFVMTTPLTRAIRLVVVVEEAHNIVGCSREAAPSEENADPKAYASEFVCRMLAEFRALGVGLIIVNQLPSAVAPDVVKNTGSKLTFREVDNEDREIIGGAMLFGPIEMEEIARLRPGEAYFFTEGYFGPCRILTPNLHADLRLPLPPVGDAFLPYLIDDPWFAQAAAARTAAETSQIRFEMDKFEDYRIQVMREAKALVGERLKVSRKKPQDSGHLTAIAQRAQGLRNRLRLAFSVFCRDAYRRLLPDVPDNVSIGKAGQALRRDLAKRFDSVVRPGTEKVLKMLERPVKKC